MSAAPGLDDWWHRAACRGKPGSWFFAGPNSFETRVALRLCGRCPVRLECLAEAMATEDGYPNGVRGGLTALERRSVARRGGLLSTGP